MLRIRLSVPLSLFLNSPQPDLLDLPPLTFRHSESEVQIILKGAAPLKLESGDEPHFCSIHECQVEVRQKSEAAHRLLAMVQSKDFAGLMALLMPIVNRTLAAIRNFGWVTTAREYKPEPKPETLLRAWKTRARIAGDWKEVAPKPPPAPLDLFYGLSDLEQNVERGSLSVGRWADIKEALVEGLKPNPEQEFLTNALQHLREENLRLAIVEATVCLEIVLSDCLKLYLEVKRGFSKNKTKTLLNKVELTSRVGLLVDSMLDYGERSGAKLDAVLKAINLRNTIIHRTGHLDPSVPRDEVHESIYAMLNLALTLSRKREKLRAEPEMEQIAKAIAEKFHCPSPEIEVSRYHGISATFSYQSKVSSYLRPLVLPLPSDYTTPDQAGLQRIVDGLAFKLKERDPYFDAKEHLSARFRRGVIGGFVFATFEKGVWERTPEPESNLISIAP